MTSLGTPAALSEATLTLLFTRRVGLYHWDQVGNLQREVAIYQALSEHLKKVQFITYGGQRDQKYIRPLRPIEIHPTPRRLPVFASRLILQGKIRRPVLEQSDILKTNQIPGAEIAIWAKQKYNKKLIARCGYLYSCFMEEYTANRGRIQRAYELERRAFTVADLGIVTSQRDRQWVIERHRIDPDKMHVVPNYVMTDLFKPSPQAEKGYDLVCVAKASPQKNLKALLRAIDQLKGEGLAISLLLIGSAAQDEQLRRQAMEARLNISYHQRVPNFELPGYLNQARVFVLPSLYEGHPKTLLEAMSCGLPCIGSDVAGIRDDIAHGQNGYLCRPDSNSLAEAIRTVLADRELQRRLGQAARHYILAHYSLQTILNLELALIQKLL